MKILVSLFIIFGLSVEESRGAKESQPRHSLSQSSVVLSVDEFRNLSKIQKGQYITEVRRAMVRFEYLLEKEFRYPVVRDGLNIFSVAEARFLANHCVIGGVARTVRRTSEGREICTSFGRGCSGPHVTDSGFKCGKIFAEVCVNRTPVNETGETPGISERCQRAAPPVGQLDLNTFYSDGVQRVLTRIEQVFCANSGATSEGCRYFVQRLREIKAYVASESTSTTAVDQIPCSGVYGLVLEGSREADRTDSIYQDRARRSLRAVQAMGSTMLHAVNAIGASRLGALNHSVVLSADSRHILESECTEQGQRCCQATAQTFFLEYLDNSRPTEPFSILAEESRFAEVRQGPVVPTVDSESTISGVRVSRFSDFTNSDLFRTLTRQHDNEICRSDENARRVVHMSVTSLGYHRRLDDGSDGACGILMNGQEVSAETLYTRYIRPMQRVGVEVVLDVAADSARCIANRISLLQRGTTLADGQPPACILPVVSAGGAMQGADWARGLTASSTYPHFLRVLGNPMKAQLCAAAMDPFNAPDDDRYWVDWRSRSWPRAASDLEAAFTSLGGGSLDGAAVFRDCQTARRDPGFPRPRGEMTPQVVARGFHCARAEETFLAALGGDSDVPLREALADAGGQGTWLGLANIQDYAAMSADTRQTAFSACNIDLRRVASLASRGALTGGRGGLQAPTAQ